jgi:aryl-alcohol dehydrogenase-like predicted oxidoreductase
MTQVRPLGRSGFQTPPLILGTNVFGWTTDETMAHHLLDAFVAGGGKVIDTADIYGPPNHSGPLELDHVENRAAFQGREAERIIGTWIRKRGRHDDVIISTKAGMITRAEGKACLSPESIRAAVDGSLKLLGVERLDIFHAHIDDPETPLVETLGTLDQLVRQGKVATIAAANYSVDRLAEALEVSRANGFASFQIVQGMYSLMERAEYEGRLQALCQEHDIAFTGYLGLASGFLSGKYRSVADVPPMHPRANILRLYFNERGIKVLDALDQVSCATGEKPARIALAWVATQPGVAAPLSSATNPLQLEDLLGAMDLTLSPEHIALLDRASWATQPVA